MILVDTFIAGRPKTKGSLVVNRQGAARDTDGSKHWRAIMAGALRDDHQMRWRLPHEPDITAPPYNREVRVTVAFLLPCAPTLSGAGDLDKLERNLLDALGCPRPRSNPKLSASVLADDNLVCEIISRKMQAPRGVSPGIRVKVETLPDDYGVTVLPESTTHGRVVA